jgi:uncharacterized lipoprotein YajG
LFAVKKPRALRGFGNQKRKEVITSMKKLISLVLCLVIALAFVVGCKKKEETTTTETTTTTAPVPQAPMSSVTTDTTTTTTEHETEKK